MKNDGNPYDPFPLVNGETVFPEYLFNPEKLRLRLTNSRDVVLNMIMKHFTLLSKNQ
jgi:hypothetical protein